MRGGPGPAFLRWAASIPQFFDPKSVGTVSNLPLQFSAENNEMDYRARTLFCSYIIRF
jgi:hypothetical protein